MIENEVSSDGDHAHSGVWRIKKFESHSKKNKKQGCVTVSQSYCKRFWVTTIKILATVTTKLYLWPWYSFHNHYRTRYRICTMVWVTQILSFGIFKVRYKFLMYGQNNYFSNSPSVHLDKLVPHPSFEIEEAVYGDGW